MISKNINTELFEFIKDSPTCFHAVHKMSEMLENEGYTRLLQKEAWQVESGGKYYVTQNGSSLIAFNMPLKDYVGVHMVAAHSDAPCFKVKENPEIKNNNSYTTLNVEAYGGMLCAPWFDRPLSIAGRVVVKDGDKLKSLLVNLDKNMVSIVNLAVHMDREINTGKNYKIQTDMLPIFAGDTETSLKKIVADKLDINEQDILDSELFLYNRQEGAVWGANDEFISAPRLDDLQCAFAAVKALLCANSEDKICLAAIFDNEEVGSATRQGADSTFLKHVLQRIALACNKTQEQALIVLANSSMLSADNGHALHPNYEAKADVTNKPYLNGGVVLKYSANQKYTTNAVTGAAVKSICKEAGVPCQVFVNHSDVRGGSTLGNISTSQVSVPCADIGVAMLAMHSCYETAGAHDTQRLLLVLEEYFKTDIM